MKPKISLVRRLRVVGRSSPARGRSVVAIAVLLLASLVAAPLAASASGGASPAVGTQTGSFGPIPYNGDEQSRCQGLSVGSHVVPIGGEVVGTASAGICGSTPTDITFTWGVAPGSAVSGCQKDDKHCVFRTGSTNGQYTLLCISGSNVQGAWQSCDYYGTPGAGLGTVDGFVLDKSGDPVPGVDVTAYGAPSYGATTNADGWYAIQLKAGSYRILPSGGPRGKAAPTYVPHQNDTTVSDGTEGRADFQLQAGIELKLHFDETEVPANGMAVVNGMITTTEFGKPLPNVTVQLEAMPSETYDQAVTDAPKASVCNSGNRLWPTGTISDPDGKPVTITTDATGHYPLAITVGTTPGTWTLDAWAYDSVGHLSSDTTAASEDQSIRFKSLGAIPTVDFVHELNVAEKSVTALQGAGANSFPIVNALAPIAAATGSGFNFGGLAFGLVNAPDGQSIIIFPADKAPRVSPSGILARDAINADDLILDPAEWSTVSGGASLSLTLNNGTLVGLPTLKTFAAGGSAPGWKLVAGSTITPFSQSFEYLGYGYLGLGAAGACY